MAKRSGRAIARENLYRQLMSRVFGRHYRAGLREFEFARDELPEAAKALGLRLPKNLGDLVYSFRYRAALPQEVSATAVRGKEWVILGAGKGRYRFKQVRFVRIVPNASLVTIKIPAATPEIVVQNAQTDEQALLARVRYNRMVDLFLGTNAFSLQNHLRSFAKGIGQIEIDELYVGVNKQGNQFVIPVQAKGGSDFLAAVQTTQDMAWCRERFPHLICRPVSVQFMADERIAMFELTLERGEVALVEERHYRLVPGHDVTNADLDVYRARA